MVAHPSFLPSRAWRVCAHVYVWGAFVVPFLVEWVFVYVMGQRQEGKGWVEGEELVGGGVGMTLLLCGVMLMVLALPLRVLFDVV